MGGVAKDYSQMVLALMNDQILCDLMLIPKLEQKNTLMYGKYFVEAFTSSVITLDGICRLLIKSAPQSFTNNQFVKEDSVIIEVFVPVKKDRSGVGFERLSNQIIDRIYTIFTKKRQNRTTLEWSKSALINDKKMCLEGRNELNSPSLDFIRMFIGFSFKRVYS